MPRFVKAYKKRQVKNILYKVQGIKTLLKMARICKAAL
jgi:hypothetical protein